MAKLKKIGILSAGKLLGVLYAFLGLIIGFFMFVGSLIGSSFFPKKWSILLGAGAIVGLPIFYGGIGFIAGIIGAALYNLIASWVGGIELDLE